MLSEKARENKRLYDKKYRQDHKEERKIYNENYRKTHPEYQKRQKEYNKNYISKQRFHRYGISEEEFKLRVENQNNLCAICFKVMESPNVDHDHITGKNRSLLCRHCNSGLGMFFDNMNILKSAADYLKKHSVETGSTHT